MKQTEILQHSLNQMTNIFSSREFLTVFRKNGGDDKLIGRHSQIFLKSNCDPLHPDHKKPKTWIKKMQDNSQVELFNEDSEPIKSVISEPLVIQYLFDHANGEKICIEFLKIRGYKLFKAVEIEI